MDVSIGEKFRTRTDGGQHDQIAALGVDLLAAADRCGHYPSGTIGRGWLGGLGGRLGGKVQLAFPGAGRWQHRQVERARRVEHRSIAGPQRQRPQAVLAAQRDEGWQVETAIGGQFVQRKDQRGVVEKLRRLRDLHRQLLIETLQIGLRQLQHGDGKHAALELEYGGLVGEIGLAHGLPAAVNGEDL